MNGSGASWPRAFRGLALAALLAAPAGAHDFWIEPSSFRPAAASVVSVRLKVGMQFQGDPVPRLQPLIMRFAVLDAAGERAIPGQEGADPAGYLRPGAGSSTMVYLSAPSEVELEGAKFEAYLREEGLDAIVALRAKRGESAKPAKDAYIRCAKALIGGGPGFDRPAGLPLELVPEKDPGALYGGPLPLRLLLDGKPLAGARISAINRRDPSHPVSARTDRHGRVSLRLPATGVWLVKAVHMDAAPPELHADWRSRWASLTFELP